MIEELTFALAIFVLGLSWMALIDTFADKFFAGGISVMLAGFTVALVFSGPLVNNNFLFWMGIALVCFGIFVASTIEIKTGTGTRL